MNTVLECLDFVKWVVEKLRFLCFEKCFVDKCTEILLRTAWKNQKRNLVIHQLF